MRTAILTYIIIVAVICHFLLAKLWDPQGWQRVADTIEHVVTPALYVIDWVLFVPKGTVNYRSAFIWLGYPLAYAAYSLIHGGVTGFYPFPLINVAEFGYDKVLLNMGVLVLVFLGLTLVLISLDHWLGRLRTQTSMGQPNAGKCRSALIRWYQLACEVCLGPDERFSGTSRR